MTDATASFFDGLSRHGHEPLLKRVRGTARFEIADGGETEHWRVEIVKGDVRVTHGTGPADCVIRTDRALLNDIASGRVNAMAEMLRGGLALDGDPELLVLIQRLFPGRSSQRRETAAATATGTASGATTDGGRS